MKLLATHLHSVSGLLFFWLIMVLNSGCNSNISKDTGNEQSQQETKTTKSDLPINKIKLPPGFTIDVYAEGLHNARSLELSPSGVLFVSTKDHGEVYAVKDTDGNFKADKKWVIADGLNMPNGVALKDGALYIAEVSRIWKYPDIENNLDNPQKELFVDAYPSKEHHGWKYIAFGPDGYLCVPVGTPCIICEIGRASCRVRLGLM